MQNEKKEDKVKEKEENDLWKPLKPFDKMIKFEPRKSKNSFKASDIYINFFGKNYQFEIGTRDETGFHMFQDGVIKFDVGMYKKEEAGIYFRPKLKKLTTEFVLFNC